MNDALLFYIDKKESILASKAILLAFEEVYGPRINLRINMVDNEIAVFADWMNCRKDSFSFARRLSDVWRVYLVTNGS